MTFTDPRWLWALLALPLLALFEWRAAGRATRALAQLVGARADHPLLVQRRPGQRLAGAVLRLAALALLIAGAARPEWGREVVRRAATGSDVVLLVDVSASMDARDVAPSRLAEAQREALAVVDHLAGSRIGVVAFAGDAVRLCPLTLDRGAARLTLEALSSATVSQPGTDLGKGLRAAMKLMPAGRREEQAMVLWTDGEDLEAGARAALDEAQGSGIRVFTVGVGTPAGDVVPVMDDEGRTLDVKRDAQGQVVRSQLDEDLLRTIARRTRGAYFAAQRPGGELPRLLGALGTVAHAGRGQRLVERPVARFPLCAALAALLLALDRIRPRRRTERLRRPRSARRRASAAAAPRAAAWLLAAGALLAPHAAQAQSAWSRGDDAYRAGRFAQAESLYDLRLARSGPAAVRLNRAIARARAGRQSDAERELAELGARRDRLGREARYDLGTLKAEQQHDDDALAVLRDALVHDPGDQDARWNYEILLRRRQRGQPPKSPPQKGGQQDQSAGASATPKSGDQGSQQPQQQPAQAPRNAPPPSPSPPTPGAPGQSQRMDRAQADRLLNALQDLARLEQQRRHPVPVTRERRGKDW